MKTLEWLHYTETQRRRLFSYLKKKQNSEDKYRSNIWNNTSEGALRFNFDCLFQ